MSTFLFCCPFFISTKCNDDAFEIYDETVKHEDDDVDVDDVEDDEKCIMYSILLHYSREFSKLITNDNDVMHGTKVHFTKKKNL